MGLYFLIQAGVLVEKDPSIQYGHVDVQQQQRAITAGDRFFPAKSSLDFIDSQLTILKSRDGAIEIYAL